MERAEFEKRHKQAVEEEDGRALFDLIQEATGTRPVGFMVGENCARVLVAQFREYNPYPTPDK